MNADFSRVTLTMTSAEFKTMQNIYDFMDNYINQICDDVSVYEQFVGAFGYGDINKVNRDLDRMGIYLIIDDERGK